MSELSLTTHGENFEQVVARLSPEIRKRGLQEFSRLLYALRAEARRKFDSALHSRTGALKASIETQKPEIRREGIVGHVVASQKLPYGLAQERGATIVPKRVRFLTIPLDAAKTAVGVERFSARQMLSAGYTGSFVRNGVLFGKRGEEAVPLFALRRSVTLPPRPFMGPALETMRPAIVSSLGAVVGAAGSG